jgi:hypothetical protein
MQLSFSLSNLKNVQMNTDVFSDTQRYLYTKCRVNGIPIFQIWERVAEEVF